MDSTVEHGGAVTLPNGVRLIAGHGGLPAVEVALPSASALIYLHGAHVAAWQPAGQSPVLWMSKLSAFTTAEPLRGGIPICFPWFGQNLHDASLPNHAWARLAQWTLTEATQLREATQLSNAVQLRFELTNASEGVPDDAAPLHLEYLVTIGATLETRLLVRNDGDTAFRFEEAFHTYFAVADATAAQIRGLETLSYVDKTVSPEVTASSAQPLTVASSKRESAQIERLYPMPASIDLLDRAGNRTIHIASVGAAQSVIWNPGSTKAKSIADFGNDEWLRMVCIEAVNARSEAITLEPGATHQMTATVTVSNTQSATNTEDQNDMQLLDIARLSRDIHLTEALPTKAIQFGEGNFLRAFVDWQIQQMNNQGLFNGGVAVVQPLPGGMVAALAEQDNLYTVLLEGKQDGAEVQSHEVITVVNKTVDPYLDYQSYLALADDDNIEFIFSNTTEAGIVFSEQDALADAPQKSFPGKLTALLYRRFQLGKRGFTLIPCELIEHNGEKLRETVLASAIQWGLGDDFSAWITNENTFCSSLVDRIVPGYPKDRAAELCTEFGYEDRFIVKAEPFLLWVIEGPASLAESLPLKKAGLNVTVTDDMTPYRERKVFLLNGPHTTMAAIARLAGLETVREVMQDAQFGALIHREMYEEIIPVLDLPEEELTAYAESVKERFDNPFMHHELASIALNSASKFTSRLLPILLGFHAKTGNFPPRITLALSALLLTYSGSSEVSITPVDSDETIHAFRTAYTTDSFVATVLSNESLWGRDLSAVDGLVDQVQRGLDSLVTRGVRASLTDLI